MKELGEALKLIFAKVAGFFDIFDLSFFVSGIASASALAIFVHHAGVPVTTMLASKTGIFLAALASYGLGLVSFASGRLVQRGVAFVQKKEEMEGSEARFRKLLTAHGLAEQQPFKEYLSKENEKSNGIQALYTRLWAEVRHSERVSASLELLNSYWVKAATYDWLSVSLLLWSGVFLSSAFGWVVPSLSSSSISAVFATIFFGASLTCLREARRYREYQAKELVATIAAIRDK